MSKSYEEKYRSKIMSSIRSQSKLENRVSRALWSRGFRFRKNTKLFGKPDISIQKYNVVIFIDSCFWHNCPLHGNIPKTNQDFWAKKLGRNLMRDIEVTNYYCELDWNILRIWEHELKEDFDVTIDKIEDFILEAKRRKDIKG